MRTRRLLLVALIVLLLAASTFAQDLASFEKRVSVYKLANGMTFVVLRRPEAPVFSFFTYVDVGSVQEPAGETGLAHMFEHMAFKGTPTIGTTNWPAEKASLAKVEQAYAAYNAERLKRVGQDKQKLAQLKQAWQQATEAADQYVVKNAFPEIIERNGGADLNAFTNDDQTGYFYSMPVNRLKLWAFLESERYLHPVFREFYQERNVVMEERRMRTESSPIGRLVEQFLAQAFIAHPYHHPTVGWASDLETFSATDAQRFYDRYYIPANMVVAVVGDVDPAAIKKLADEYFARLPGKPKPQPVHTEEPPQNSERRVVLQEISQPVYLEGYHRPSYLSDDDPVYDVMADILSRGRTSRLYRSLVRDKRLALMVEGFTGFPGVKYPQLFSFYAVPNQGHTTDELRTAIHEELEKLKTQPVTDEELQMTKTRAKADLIRSLNSNSGMAQALASYQTLYGDWRELFRSVDRIDKVTKDDVLRVAKQTFTPTNRTVGIIETMPPPGEAPPQQQGPQPQQAPPANPPAQSETPKQEGRR